VIKWIRSSSISTWSLCATGIDDLLSMVSPPWLQVEI
jgi:hypothetical protein